MWTGSATLQSFQMLQGRHLPQVAFVSLPQLLQPCRQLCHSVCRQIPTIHTVGTYEANISNAYFSRFRSWQTSQLMRTLNRLHAKIDVLLTMKMYIWVHMHTHSVQIVVVHAQWWWRMYVILRCVWWCALPSAGRLSALALCSSPDTYDTHMTIKFS